jgi:hypothetical protein
MSEEITWDISYYDNNGKYQKELDMLVKQIPDQGESFDTRIELLRMGLNIYHEMFNNGMINCVEGYLESRKEEYDYVSSKVDMGYVDEYMKIKQTDFENEVDGSDGSESEKQFYKACNAMDLVMNRIMEKILKTGILK